MTVVNTVLSYHTYLSLARKPGWCRSFWKSPYLACKCQHNELSDSDFTKKMFFFTQKAVLRIRIKKKNPNPDPDPRTKFYFNVLVNTQNWNSYSNFFTSKFILYHVPVCTVRYRTYLIYV